MARWVVPAQAQPSRAGRYQMAASGVGAENDHAPGKLNAPLENIEKSFGLKLTRLRRAA